MVRLVPLEAGGHQRIHRKAVPRQADRRCRDLAKAHRAIAPERRDPGVGGGRHHGSQHALRDFAAVLALKELRVEGPWPGAETGDRHDLLFVGEVDHDRRDPGDIDEIALQDTERDPGSAARIDRVAAGLQNVEACGRRQIVARRYGVPGHSDGRPMGGCCGHGDPFLRCFRCATVALDRPPVEEAL